MVNEGVQTPQVTPPPEVAIVEKHPVAEALRAELLKLAQEGDSKHKGALTAEVLMRIVRVAKTGHDLLVSLNIGASGLAGLVRRPRSPGLFSTVGGSQEFADDGLSDPQPMGSMPFAYSPPSENFGMTAIRELVAVAKNFNGGGNSPAKLVEAIAVAREKGLTDVAKELESQLGLPKLIPAVTPVPVDLKKGA